MSVLKKEVNILTSNHASGIQYLTIRHFLEQMSAASFYFPLSLFLSILHTFSLFHFPLYLFHNPSFPEFFSTLIISTYFVCIFSLYLPFHSISNYHTLSLSSSHKCFCCLLFLNFCCNSISSFFSLFSPSFFLLSFSYCLL